MYRKIKKFRVRTRAAIQFHYGERNLVVGTQYVNSLIEDIVVQCEDLIDNIRVEGIWFPRLVFDWKAQIKDGYTKEKVEVLTSIKLSWLEAKSLSVMLKKNYKVCLVIQSEGRTKRVQVQVQMKNVKQVVKFQKDVNDDTKTCRSMFKIPNDERPISKFQRRMSMSDKIEGRRFNEDVV